MVLFCDVFIVIVEPLVESKLNVVEPPYESKSNIGGSPIDWSRDIVEPKVHDVGSAKYFFNDQLYMKWKK